VNVHDRACGKLELARRTHRSNGFSSTIEGSIATTSELKSAAII